MLGSRKQQRDHFRDRSSLLSCNLFRLSLSHGWDDGDAPSDHKWRERERGLRLSRSGAPEEWTSPSFLLSSSCMRGLASFWWMMTTTTTMMMVIKGASVGEEVDHFMQISWEGRESGGGGNKGIRGDKTCLCSCSTPIKRPHTGLEGPDKPGFKIRLSMIHWNRQASLLPSLWREIP